DLDMAAWLRAHGRALQCVATKWDRLSGNERPSARRRFEAAFAAPILPCSATAGEGIAAVQHAVLHAAPARTRSALHSGHELQRRG
ncbi:MAG: hypothetical protein ACRD0Y_11110, partial [Terriglobales bacterium]